MNINDARALMNVMRSARDPQQFLKQYARTNSSVREVMDMVDRCGDPKSAFYQMASAKGIDPEQILSMIRK